MDEELQRELHEAGVAPEDIAGLARLAEEIAKLPDGQPRPAWLTESKERLMKRFERPTDAPTQPDEPAAE